MIQNQSQIDLKSEFRNMYILCNTLIFGMTSLLIISIICVFWLKVSINRDNSNVKVLLIAASLMAAVSLWTSNMNYKRQMSIIANCRLELKQKLEIYRATFIRFMSINEFAGLFGVIGLFLTGNYWFVLITLIMLSAMISRKPTKSRMVSELQLDSQQQIDLQ